MSGRIMGLTVFFRVWTQSSAVVRRVLRLEGNVRLLRSRLVTLPNQKEDSSDDQD
jgi:hypothetical protein